MTTKLHLSLTAEGHIVEGMLTGGHKADISVAEELTAGIVGCAVVADKGYDSDKYRQDLFSQNNLPGIPGRKNRKMPIVYDKKLYALRRRIEYFFAQLKENKRLAVQYEKSDVSFLAFVALATIKTYLC